MARFGFIGNMLEKSALGQTAKEVKGALGKEELDQQRQDMINLIQQLENTASIIKNNNDALTNRAKVDDEMGKKIGTMLWTFAESEGTRQTVLNNLLDKQEIGNKEAAELINAMEQSTKLLSNIETDLEIKVSDVVSQYKKVYQDARMDEHYRVQYLKEIVDLADASEISSSALKELKTINLDKAHQDKNTEIKVLTLLGQLEHDADTQEMILKGNARELGRQMDQMVLGQDEMTRILSQSATDQRSLKQIFLENANLVSTGQNVKGGLTDLVLGSMGLGFLSDIGVTDMVMGGMLGKGLGKGIGKVKGMFGFGGGKDGSATDVEQQQVEEIQDVERKVGDVEDAVRDLDDGGGIGRRDRDGGRDRRGRDKKRRGRGKDKEPRKRRSRGGKRRGIGRFLGGAAGLVGLGGMFGGDVIDMAMDAMDVGGDVADVADIAKGKMGRETAEVITKKAGKEAAETVAKKAGTKAIGKVGAKALGKSALKKIPLLGAVAGLGFMGQRFMSGDISGGLGELASGLASTIPGIGTAASLAIDAGLAAKDIASANQEVTKDQKKNLEKMMSPEAFKVVVDQPDPARMFEMLRKNGAILFQKDVQKWQLTSEMSAKQVEAAKTSEVDQTQLTDVADAAPKTKARLISGEKTVDGQTEYKFEYAKVGTGKEQEYLIQEGKKQSSIDALQKSIESDKYRLDRPYEFSLDKAKMEEISEQIEKKVNLIEDIRKGREVPDIQKEIHRIRTGQRLGELKPEIDVAQKMVPSAEAPVIIEPIKPVQATRGEVKIPAPASRPEIEPKIEMPKVKEKVAIKVTATYTDKEGNVTKGEGDAKGTERVARRVATIVADADLAKNLGTNMIPPGVTYKTEVVDPKKEIPKTDVVAKAQALPDTEPLAPKAPERLMGESKKEEPVISKYLDRLLGTTTQEAEPISIKASAVDDEGKIVEAVSSGTDRLHTVESAKTILKEKMGGELPADVKITKIDAEQPIRHAGEATYRLPSVVTAPVKAKIKSEPYTDTTAEIGSSRKLAPKEPKVAIPPAQRSPSVMTQKAAPTRSSSKRSHIDDFGIAFANSMIYQ